MRRINREAIQMVANANINQGNLTPTGRRRRRRTGTYAKGLRTSQAQSGNSAQMFGNSNLQQQEQIATTIGTAVGAACAAYTNLLNG